MTQLPFGVAGSSHHALSCILSLAITSASAAFGGAVPRRLGTCSIAAQKPAHTPTKHRAQLRLTANVMATFLDQIKSSPSGLNTSLLHDYGVKKYRIR